MTPSARFEKALKYAVSLHRSQLRKGTEIPYVAHLLGVCSIALYHGANEEEAIAALLHDVVEDQGGQPRLEEIRAQFGDKVAEIVAGCTDTDTIPKPPWRERKQAYLDHLRGAAAPVRFVAACDKLENIQAMLRDYREMGESLWSRFNAGKEEQLWFFRLFIEILRQAGPSRLAEDLDRNVSELERLVSQTRAV